MDGLNDEDLLDVKSLIAKAKTDNVIDFEDELQLYSDHEFKTGIPKLIYENLLAGEELTKSLVDKYLNGAFITDAYDLWYAHNVLLFGLRQAYISPDNWGSIDHFQLQMMEDIYSNIKKIPVNPHTAWLVRNIAVNAKKNNIINNPYDLIQDLNMEAIKNSLGGQIGDFKKELRSINIKIAQTEQKLDDACIELSKIVSTIQRQKKIRFYGSVAKTFISLIPLVGGAVGAFTESCFDFSDLSALSNLKEIYKLRPPLDDLPCSEVAVFVENKDRLTNFFREIRVLEPDADDEQIESWVKNKIEEGIESLPDLIDSQVSDSIEESWDKLADDLSSAEHNNHEIVLSNDDKVNDPQSTPDYEDHRTHGAKKRRKNKLAKSKIKRPKNNDPKLNPSYRYAGNTQWFILKQTSYLKYAGGDQVYFL